MSDIATQKTWADADDELHQDPIVKTNADGTKTVISLKVTADGKKIRVTQKVKETIVKETVNKDVAKRKNWKKFGAERDTAPGPDFRTTQIGDPVYLRLGTSWKALEKEEEEKKASETAKSKQQTIRCRTCNGAHFTSKCPFKDTLGGDPAAPSGDASADPLASAADTSASGKYVLPHIRNRVPGAPLERNYDREDSTTLRITQLNENATEEDLREDLLRFFGHVIRVNIVRNKETGRSKGLAFVQFGSESTAQLALEKLNGRGYRNLILRVDWSKPKK